MNEASAVASKVCPACGARCPGDALYCPNDGVPLQGEDETRPKDDAPTTDPYLGLELAGHIVVRELVGVGAMGRVYRAFQKGIDRNVAVKILHRELSANTQLVARFTREAKVVSRLSHPNVVHVLLTGQLDDGALYIVMEYLDGQSLQGVLAAAPKGVSLSRALHIGLQLCDAVGEAHEQGVVHRDIKPENVMLVRRGADEEFVKVLDFGIARVNWGGEPSVATAAGLIFGTARYISPEGAQGAAVVPASDVYAIATIFYQLLTGRTPFDGDQAVGLLVQQIHDPPPPLRSIPHAVHVPAPIADVIMANLAKSPSARAPDAHAFGQAIVEAAKRAGLSAEDLSRPILQHKPNPLHLPPSDRAKQFELTPDILARMGPPPAQPPIVRGGATALLSTKPSAPTTKWEPPSDFQVKLNAAAQTALSPAPRVATVTAVDDTLDDAASPPTPARAPGGATAYVTPLLDAAPPRTTIESAHAPLPDRRSSPDRASSPDDAEDGASFSRGFLIVALCFVIGAALAGVFAWKMGKTGASDAERVAARATEAMLAGRFDDPPGDNVRDLTDDGLRRHPNEPRLVDVRVRAARGLVTRAVTKHDAGDRAGAIKDLELAIELDPNDTTASRWIDRYQAELSTFNAGAVLSAPQILVPTADVTPEASAEPVRIGTKATKTSKTKKTSPSSTSAAEASSAHEPSSKKPEVKPEADTPEPAPAPTPSIKWM